MSAFVRILNWEHFQHYKDRNPPWIKLHRELLTSETWVSSSNDDRVLAVAIMMLAAATGNRIPANPRYIQRIAYLEKEPDFAGLVRLKFIEIIDENGDASKLLADARPETETETDKSSVEANASTGAAAPQPPSAIDLKAAIFASGVPLLTSTGTTDRNARSMLGRWRKDHGDGAVLDALSAATVVSPSEAIPFIIKVLENRSGKSAPGQSHNPRGQRPSAGLDLIRSAFEEAAERGDQEAGGGDWGSLPALGTG